MIKADNLNSLSLPVQFFITDTCIITIFQVMPPTISPTVSADQSLIPNILNIAARYLETLIDMNLEMKTTSLKLESSIETYVTIQEIVVNSHIQY